MTKRRSDRIMQQAKKKYLSLCPELEIIEKALTYTEELTTVVKCKVQLNQIDKLLYIENILFDKKPSLYLIGVSENFEEFCEAFDKPEDSPINEKEFNLIKNEMLRRTV